MTDAPKARNFFSSSLRMVYTEAQLSAYHRCPGGDFKQDLFEEIIFSVAKMAISGASSFRFLQLPELRNLFSRAWEKHKADMPEAAYVKGHRMIPGISQRLGQFLRLYQVIVPVRPAELAVGPDRIKVEYGVCRRWRKSEAAVCLSLQRSKPAGYFQYPDPVVLARWLHCAMTEGREIRILHVPLLNGNSWMSDGYSMSLVRGQLDAMLSSMRCEVQVFRAGPHCESCVSRRCLERV